MSCFEHFAILYDYLFYLLPPKTNSIKAAPAHSFFGGHLCIFRSYNLDLALCNVEIRTRRACQSAGLGRGLNVGLP